MYRLGLCLLLFAYITEGASQINCPTRKKLVGLALASKLVGGKSVPWGRYPYMASLRTQQSRQHICGGTLIGKNLVLTAAHCVHKAKIDAEPHPFLRIGGTDLDDDLDAEEIQSCRTFIHSKYNPVGRISPYDIALIQLAEDSNKQTCRIGRAASGRVTAVGWGLNERGFRAPVARELDLAVVGLSQCRREPIIEYKSLLDSQMCAAADHGDVCSGDSGGPLLQLGEGCGEEDLLWGLVSGGVPCFDRLGHRTFADIPGVYTRISSFIDWIDSLSEDNFTLYTNPSCKKEPPQNLVLGTKEAVQIPPAVGVPALNDEGGCFFVEGIIFARGLTPLNDGNEDATDTPEECCALCKNTPGCRAWSYFRVEEMFSPKGACWLTSIVAPASRCTVCTSGLVKEESLNTPEEDCKILLGMDFKGSDLLSVTLPKVQDCCKECKAESKCSSFTYATDTKTCYLKSGIGELQICARCQSGIILDRVQKTDDVEVILTLLPGMEKTLHNLKQTTIPGPCRLSIGMDHKGGSLLKEDNVPVVTTPEECCNLCRETQGCRSWTIIIVPTTFHPLPGECYMRSDVPEQVPCAACTSGVVEGQGASGISDPNCGLLEGVNLEKEDLDIPAPFTDSPKECCKLCAEQDGCKSWTRVRMDGKCFMKKIAAPVVRLCRGCDSGVRLDKVTSAEITRLDPVLVKA